MTFIASKLLLLLSKAITGPLLLIQGSQPKDINKKRTVLQYRPRTPDQHAAFLAHLSHMNWDEVTDITDTQTAFDKFYAIVLSMLDRFYPLRAVTVTNRDKCKKTYQFKTHCKDDAMISLH